MPTPLPAKLPNVTGQGHTASGFRMAFAAINQLIEVCRSLTPAKSDNTLTSHTALGVLRKGNPAPTQQGGGLNWRGEWDAGETYAIDDVVIRKSDADYEDGTVAGTYVAIAQANPGDIPVHGDGQWELLSKSHFDRLLIKGGDDDGGYVDVDSSAANGKVLRVQEIDTCENGIPRKRMIIASDPY
jgi:hypothetical protein